MRAAAATAAIGTDRFSALVVPQRLHATETQRCREGEPSRAPPATL